MIVYVVCPTKTVLEFLYKLVVNASLFLYLLLRVNNLIYTNKNMLLFCGRSDVEYAKHDGHDDIPSVGQQQKHKENTRTLTKTSRRKMEQHANGARSNAESDSRDQEELQLSQVLASFNYSGVLPPPEIFERYDDKTKERMCKWNDANTSDESKRQDRLVDHEIRQNKRGAVLSFVLMVVFVIATLYAFVTTHDKASFIFLSVPALNVIGNFIQSVHSNSSK